MNESEMLLTNPQDIIDEINQKLKVYEETLEDLAEVTNKFIMLYDENITPNFGDATTIKQKMKDIIAKVVNDEL